MDEIQLPYGSGSVIYISRNTLRPYCARKYRESNPNGNPRYEVIGYYATKEEAYQALLEASELTGRDLMRDRMTLQELMEHYLESHDYLSKMTVDNIKRLVRKYCADMLERPYKEIRTDDMREVIKKIEATGTKKAARHIFVQLDKEADSLDISGKRYAQFLPVVRARETDIKEKREPFTETEMRAFLDHRHDRDMYLVLFLCYTGFRQGGFRQILKKNVDLEKMTVTGGIKTEAGRMRTVPLHPNIQPYVRQLMDKKGKYLLTNEHGEAMVAAELSARFHMAIAPYVNERYVPHESRHTFHSKLEEEGVDSLVICELMGHEPPFAGQRYYSNVTLEKKREAIMKLWS